VKAELEHVSRWLWWQEKGAGAELVNSFNRNPKGIVNLKSRLESERWHEAEYQRAEIHRNGRHTIETNPKLRDGMDEAVLRDLIENVGPVEFPHLRP
jgi:hypothetical protein